MEENNQTAFFLQWLIDQCKQHPERRAVIDHEGSRITTYGELYVMACRVVGYLDSQNIPPHSFIGICLPTSMEYISAELGIWLAGHAIVPMGERFPESRIRQIMEHSEAPLLIDEKVIKEIHAASPVEPSVLPTDDDINSLFYTSGSTGAPKGVLHTFRSFGIPLFPDEMFREMKVSLMAVTAPMFFVACKLIYDFLTRGGTVNIVPDEARMDIHKLEDYLIDQQIEFVFIPPSVLPNFKHYSSKLKIVFTASERVSGVGPKEYKLINYCGQTETAGIGCTFQVDKPYENTPIGIPVKPYIYSVQDEEGQEVNPGEEGELCYRGDLTPGYFKDPERTALLYRGGWLHTGDIVRARPDGNLILVNRKDWMVKINGQRVEPNEVATVIKKMPGIDKAIVKGFSTGNKRQYLCAYYISESGVSEADLFTFLSARLPSYMIPVYFVKMDRFPVNMNGKTDYKALLSPATDDDILDREDYIAPVSEIEKKLCLAFEKTLGYQNIGVNEDFFALGGDSIRVMTLQALCADMGLTARMIYEYRTPEKLAIACQQQKESLPHQPQTSYPLSQTQLGIYAECMSHPGETIYNNGVLFRLSPQIDTTRLARSVEQLVAAHPYILLSIQLDSEGNPRQYPHEDSVYVQTVETLTDQQVDAVRHTLVQPFNLLGDQLFRIRILKTPSTGYLFMDFHHIIFDGLSFNIIINDLNLSYQGRSVPVEQWSGFDVALEEEQLRKGEAYHDSMAWQKEQFFHLDISSLPMADVSGNLPTCYATAESVLPIDIRELTLLCDRLEVTPNVLMVASFGYLLGVCCHSNESLFSTVYNGRKDLKTSRTIGMLVKAFAVHAHWDKHTSRYDYLQSVKQQVLGSMNHDLFSFAELCAANRNINSHVLFAYQGDLESEDHLGGERFEQVPVMEHATGEQLAFEVRRQQNQLLLHVNYHSNLYSSQFISTLQQTFGYIVNAFLHVSAKEQPLTMSALLSADEQRHLLSLGKGDLLVYDTTQTVVSLFHQQAQRLPEMIAVVDAVSTMTYQELDHKSDILANELLKAGVGTNDFVGLMFPRQKEFMVAVLAVFKAGAAYIPLDSDYPEQRLQYMMDDAQARVLITTNELKNNPKHRNFCAPYRVVSIEDVDFCTTVPMHNNSQPDGLAYMIYTSGSTGRPKGVMVSHGSLLAFVTWLSRVEELKAGEQCAIHTSFSFDGSMFDLFPPLVNGATLHILSTSIRQDLNALYNYLSEHHIVGMLLTTQLGITMMSLFKLPLRFLMVGGEKLTSFTPSDVKLYNCYGPTEFTVCSTYHLVDQTSTKTPIPIGRPVPNSIAVVVDQNDNLVPQGVPGELCMLGRQLTKGYWNRERLTNEHYTTCPFIQHERMYHTGDLVRWTPSGELEFLGRLDHQIKVNGYRIELGEIEEKILSYPSVTIAVVLLLTVGQQERLVAYYCASENVSSQTLQNHLLRLLPGYMVPSVFVQLKQMPLAVGGKIDREALSNEKIFLSPETSLKVLPGNKQEEVLYELAQNILNDDSFGVTDDLTLYGLTSLQAIRLSLLASQGDVKIKVNDILKYKTIRQTVSHEMTMGEWSAEFDPSKPVLVFLQGVTSFQRVQFIINSLSNRYNLFTIEPLDEHIEVLFNTEYEKVDEVIRLYADYLELHIPRHAAIALFMGHSFGGELAYRCAVEWERRTRHQAKVCMLDTYSIIGRLLKSSQLENQKISRKEIYDQIEELRKWNRERQQILALEESTSLPVYMGDVLLIKAQKVGFSLHTIQIAVKEQDTILFENQKKWQSLAPHIVFRNLPADHYSMLEENNAVQYLPEIDSFISPSHKKEMI